jgi:hypothetical protein
MFSFWLELNEAFFDFKLFKLSPTSMRIISNTLNTANNNNTKSKPTMFSGGMSLF